MEPTVDREGEKVQSVTCIRSMMLITAEQQHKQKHNRYVNGLCICVGEVSLRLAN
jgi:hypothetical protein